MNLKSIEIKNFKSIGEKTQKIEFKPITLLFGPNSSGKSTIFHALHYFYEVLAFNNCDPGTCHLADGINLGGFKNLVHRHDINRSIKLKVEFEMGNSELPYYGGFRGSETDPMNEWLKMGAFFNGSEHPSFQKYELLEALDVISKYGVSIEIKWDGRENKAYVSSYKIAADNYCVIDIESNCTGTNAYLKIFDLPSSMANLDSENDRQIELFNNSINAMNESAFDLTKPEDDSLTIKYSVGKIAALPNFLSSSIHDNLVVTLDDEDIDPADLANRNAVFAFYSRLIFGSGLQLMRYLEKSIHVGPLREIPNRRYEPDNSNKTSDWYNGLGAWDQLYLGKPDLIKKVNIWLDKLKSGYQIDKEQLGDLLGEVYGFMADSNDNDCDRAYETLYKYLPHEAQIFLTEIQSNTKLKPQDVGVGISQVMPVIVSAIIDQHSSVMIEQPELHIHPSFQVELGDLFINEIFYKDSLESNKPERIEGKLFLIETHSEHLILRFMRRLFETSNDELDGESPLSPNDITVYYIEPNVDGAIIAELQLDEEGEFKRNWPKGFFNERSEELL
jgi:hypothetical protein